jgi:hypothetical protein
MTENWNLEKLEPIMNRQVRNNNQDTATTDIWNFDQQHIESPPALRDNSLSFTFTKQIPDNSMSFSFANAMLCQ